jgi:hypothetical protein
MGLSRPVMGLLYINVTVPALRTRRFPEIRTFETTDELGGYVMQREQGVSLYIFYNRDEPVLMIVTFFYLVLDKEWAG